MQRQLRQNRHRPTRHHIGVLRRQLPRAALPIDAARRRQLRRRARHLALERKKEWNIEWNGME
jgi:hypothetical protein